MLQRTDDDDDDNEEVLSIIFTFQLYHLVCTYLFLSSATSFNE